MSTELWVIAAAEAARTGGGPLWGKAAFVGVFVALLVWLLLLPTRFIDQEGVRRPWWRNARFWAVLVTIAQIGVYVVWG
jgi:quinol-cytochrome oxidoreductase complex cytochrome b subunit